MPPAHSHFPLYLAAVLLLLLLSPADAAPPTPHRNCAPPISAGDLPPCPPFPSPPSSFPFSSLPGCGHPSFQIRCSPSSSSTLISIHSHDFHLLALHPNNSLTISPLLPPSPCPVLPTSPLDLSPFLLSREICRSLSSLVPCNHSLPNSSCSIPPFHSQLARNPLSLFPACRRTPAAPTPHCTPHILSSISSLLSHGILVQWNPKTDPYFAKCSECHRAAHAALCGFNQSSPSKPFLCFPPPSPPPRRRPRRVILLAIASAIAAICISLLPIIAILRRRNRNRNRHPNTSVSELLHRHQIPHPPLYTYEQLRSWTNGFDPRRKIGDGGYGMVYLAQLDDGSIAAVKRLHRRPNQTTACARSFCNEIKILSSLRHPNLVRLHGYCCDPRGLLLVYDYVPNGTLADHLHGPRSLYRKTSLTWPVRVDVALQTARALKYLHFALKPPVVHRDITSNNIFVERDMRIKVGDFGLSRLLAGGAAPPEGAGEGAEEGCCTGPQGTPGYVDPEYHRTFRLTEKSDVYSLGVVMMELVTGMRAVDARRDKRDVSLAEMVVGRIQVGELRSVVDPLLLRAPAEEMHMGSVEAVAELAFRCVADEKDDRPDAGEIVDQLTHIRARIHALSASHNFVRREA